MVTWETPEFSHGCTKCTVTHTVVPSERDSGTSQVTATHQMTEKIHGNRQEGLRGILAVNSPGTATYNWEGTPNSQLLLRRKGFGLHIEIPDL